MSFPHKDPSFTLDQLKEVGQLFLEAGQNYFDACCKAGMSGAVIWLTAEDGKTCIFTRGEYRQRLINNIDQLGQTVYFGAMTDE